LDTRKIRSADFELVGGAGVGVNPTVVAPSEAEVAR